MSDERLQIFLNDHFALLEGEIELANRCSSNNPSGTLGELLIRLSADLKDQQLTIRNLLTTVGGAPSGIKQAAAWLAEKAGRFKLNDSVLEYSALSRVLELEMLATTAWQRVQMWQTLEMLAETDSRLNQFPLEDHRKRAEQHQETLNTARLTAAREAF